MRPIVFALTFSLACIPHTAPQAEEQDPKQSLEAVQAQIDQITTTLDSDLGAFDDTTRQLRDIEIRIGRVSRRIHDLDIRISTARGEQQRLVSEQLALERQLNEKRAELARFMRSAYFVGRQEKLKLILNQEDVSRISRMLAYHDYFNRQRLVFIEQTRQLLDAIEDNRRSLERQERELADLRLRDESERAALQVSEQSRKEILLTLESRVNAQNLALNALKKDEKALAELIRRLDQALPDIPPPEQLKKPFTQLRGQLPWPSQGRIVERFGTTRDDSGQKWDGVIIATKTDAEVRAIHHGRVIFADWLRGFGLMMIIDHGKGYMTLYGHNRSLFKDTGDWVNEGEVLAIAGNSGGQADTTVYFGIRKHGTAVNPKKWCVAVRKNRIG